MLQLVSAKPIAFNPYLGKVAGSAAAGLFMSQLLYWWDKGHYDGWIYQTIEQVQRETVLTRSEQDTAIAKWVKLGVLEKRLMAVPRRRFFRIDTDTLTRLLIKAANDAKSSKLNCGSPLAITESTSRDYFQRISTNSTTARERAGNTLGDL